MIDPLHFLSYSNEILFICWSFALLIITLLIYKTGKNHLYLLVVAFTLMMNLFVLKEFQLFGLWVTGGNALYGALFLITDVLGENHGKKAAYKAVVIGFMTSLFFVIASQVLINFVNLDPAYATEHYSEHFSLLPRVLLGSLLAYGIAQSLDVWLFGHFKAKTGGKLLWLRNNASTLISQAIDSVIFTAVGLTTFSFLPASLEGFIGLDIFWEVVLATYIIKVIFAMIDTPFVYLSKKYKPAD